MSPAHLGSLAAALAAAVTGHFVGGPRGIGILAGAVLGAGAALLAHGLVRHSLRHAPEDTFRAVALGFVMKVAFALLAGGLVVLVPRLAARVDVAALLLAYVAGALVVMASGVLDHLRLLREPRLQSAPAASETSTGNPLGPARETLL